MSFAHELRTASDHSCLVLRGEIDLAVRKDLDHVLQQAVGLSYAVTVVDLREVTYLDCCGIGVLVAAANAVRRRGNRMIVSHSGGIVRHVLELTGVLPHLTGAPPAAMRHVAIAALTPRERTPHASQAGSPSVAAESSPAWQLPA
jgi:anti-anti-sigma factor